MTKNTSLKLDSVAESIFMLPNQIADIMEQARDFKLPKDYKKVSKVVLAGMGGSNLAGRIFNAVFDQSLKAPIIINSDYELPAWVDSDALVICASYSGTTEETLAAYREAKKKKAKLAVLTSIGADNPLAKLAARNKTPILSFESKFNPSNQPRLALGYAIFSLASILVAANIIKLKPAEIKAALAKLHKWGDKLLPTKSNNAASKLAADLNGRGFVIITGEFLSGNAHALRNQTNENCKNFATYLTLPDLNHYALEGLKHPEANKNYLAWLFFESNIYSPRVQKRMALTQEVARKNRVNVLRYKLTGKTKLEQSMEMLQLGSWITYYLSGINQVDPLKIPWVDWFKKELK